MQGLRTTYIRYLTVSVGQNSERGLVRSTLQAPMGRNPDTSWARFWSAVSSCTDTWLSSESLPSGWGTEMLICGWMSPEACAQLPGGPSPVSWPRGLLPAYPRCFPASFTLKARKKGSPTSRPSFKGIS